VQVGGACRVLEEPAEATIRTVDDEEESAIASTVRSMISFQPDGS